MAPVPTPASGLVVPQSLCRFCFERNAFVFGLQRAGSDLVASAVRRPVFRHRAASRVQDGLRPIGVGRPILRRALWAGAAEVGAGLREGHYFGDLAVAFGFAQGEPQARDGGQGKRQEAPENRLPDQEQGGL